MHPYSPYRGIREWLKRAWFLTLLALALARIVNIDAAHDSASTQIIESLFVGFVLMIAAYVWDPYSWRA